MAETQLLSVPETGKPESISTADFAVSEGDLLKVRATVTDTAEAANARALVCTIRFFDDRDVLIEQAYEGTSVSAVYGSYVYIESKPDGETMPWVKEVIVAPSTARRLEVSLYPWKTSPNLRIDGEVECLDIRRIPTDEIGWNLHPGETREEEYDLLPFWRSLFSFEVLRKAVGSRDDIRIQIRFLGQEGNELEVKTASCSPVMGAINADEAEVLTALPVPQKCDYEGYERLMALVQLIPPAAAVRAVVTISNRAEVYSARVSQRIYAFETLIDSRFTTDSGCLIAQSDKLPYDLALLSFSRLEAKRPDDLSVYDAALEFYVACGAMQKITATANRILNRFQDGRLCGKARRALALVTETLPSWRPSVPKIGLVNEGVRAIASVSKVAHFLKDDDMRNADLPGQGGWALAQMQKALMGGKPIVVTPLGHPEKGQHGLPWERGEREGIAWYRLNCLSAEQLQAVPVTSQLNFMVVLVADILAQEEVELIHVQEGERGYELALAGLALSQAMHIPMVYQKQSLSENSLGLPDSRRSLAQARAARDFQCMMEADAVLVASEEQRVTVASAGVSMDKLFVLSGGADSASGQDKGKMAETCRHAYAYARIANLKKYK